MTSILFTYFSSSARCSLGFEFYADPRINPNLHRSSLGICYLVIRNREVWRHIAKTDYIVPSRVGGIGLHNMDIWSICLRGRQCPCMTSNMGSGGMFCIESAAALANTIHSLVTECKSPILDGMQRALANFQGVKNSGSQQRSKHH